MSFEYINRNYSSKSYTQLKNYGLNPNKYIKEEKIEEKDTFNAYNKLETNIKKVNWLIDQSIDDYDLLTKENPKQCLANLCTNTGILFTNSTGYSAIKKELNNMNVNYIILSTNTEKTINSTNEKIRKEVMSINRFKLSCNIKREDYYKSFNN